MLLNSHYATALLALLKINTVTPMEGGDGALNASANQAFVEMAELIGMRVLFSGKGELPEKPDFVVPRTIAQRMAERPDFLECQPHLVLELGNGDIEHTLMFNFHMDCVGPHLPASLENGLLRGRGAVDNKGPGVALLAALAALQQQCPGIFDNTRVLVMAVAGEEGGAMGVYGTRCLVERGYIGRLNVFVEPSNGDYFDTSTTSMTWEVRVDGKGSTDDFPGQGQNATLMLAFLAQHMAATLSPVMEALNVKMTLAGLHTGHQHNRVYGEGRLLFNFAYADVDSARRAREAVTTVFEDGLAAFADIFCVRPPFAHSAASIHKVCTASWISSELPVLNNRHPEMESLLCSVGLLRNANINEAFTCDAMWAQRPGSYTIVFGPGSLVRNGAHTADEHVALADLDAFADTAARLIVAFAHEQNNQFDLKNA